MMTRACPMLLGALVAGGSFCAAGAAAGARFSPVWNCPYMGKQVVGKYGLDANPSGSFNGSVVWLSYGPSTWPRLQATQGDVLPCWSGKHPCTWNQSLIWANITVASNGGVPQAGDIELHKAAVAALVEQEIPDPAWAGYGSGRRRDRHFAGIPSPFLYWNTMTTGRGWCGRLAVNLVAPTALGTASSTGRPGARASARTTTAYRTATTTPRCWSSSSTRCIADAQQMHNKMHSLCIAYASLMHPMHSA